MRIWTFDLRIAGWAAALAFCASTAVPAAVPPQSERGAYVRAVSMWDYPAGSKHCDGSARPSWDGMAMGWYYDLTNGYPAPNGHGSRAWWRDGTQRDGYIVDSQFVDPDLQSWGKDYMDDKADEPDALMVTMHGGNAFDGRWIGTVRVNEYGDDGTLNNCGAYQGHMEFGDTDLEFLHLSSCTSMDQDDWYPNWASSFKGVHQIDGFHGIMYINEGYIDDYRDFSDDAFDTSIGISWVENLYDFRSAGQNQCPVALGAGVGANGQSSAWDRLVHERYDNVYADPTTPTWYGVVWVGGCDPKSGFPLPTIGATPVAPRASSPSAKPQEGLAGSGGAADELPPIDRTARTLADYVAQVDAALPAIPSAILAAAPGPDWMASVNVALVASAIGDAPPDTIVSDGTRTEGRDAADTKVTKLDTARGRVRYINRLRHLDWDTDPHSAWSATASLAMVEGAINVLGVPAAERAPARVDTLQGQDYDAGSASSIPHSALELERWVTYERTVNGFPVEQSIVRGAVSNNGQIARLHVRWPRFRLRSGLTLRPRQDVVNELAARIQQDEFGAAVNLEIELGYVPSGADYIPAAVATLDDVYSAEIVYVPLVDIPPDRDFDAVADADDNCVEDRNPGQEDSDRDGVGDACDNCPSTFNPGQEDGDASDGSANPPDGIGDACDEVEDVCQLSAGGCEVFTAAQCLAEGAVFAADAVGPLRFTSSADLDWNAVPGTGYNLYRGTIGGASWTYDHACFEPDLPSPMASDGSVPSPDESFYYLVSVETACGETGLGSSSRGAPRPNADPCP
jgi:hypothetical protein